MKDAKRKALGQMRDKNFEKRREMRGKMSTTNIIKKHDEKE